MRTHVAVSRHGFTLIEICVLILIIAVLAALILPVFTRTHEDARRTSCASNLYQIGKAMFMYSDVPANKDHFPSASSDETGGDPMLAWGLLYPKYVADPKCFSCPQHPVSAAEIVAIKPNGRVASSFGYDPRHGPNDALAALAADMKGAGQNSDNHGPNAGQNVLIGAGTIEFMESPLRSLGSDGTKAIVDTDIFAANPEIDLTVDGYIRQK